jgi:hypothetical protein
MKSIVVRIRIFRQHSGQTKKFFLWYRKKTQTSEEWYEVWHSCKSDKTDLKKLLIRQNSCFLIRMLFIYKTLCKSLFKEDRAFSQRLYSWVEPIDLATTSWKNDKEWNEMKVRVCMNKGRKWYNNLKKKPSLHYYFTVSRWQRRNSFYEDIYNRTDELASYL